MTAALTDSQGRTVDFKNVVVIMTSNVGSRYLQDNLINNEISETARESVMAALRDHFRPEFLNRIDDVVLFKPLSLEEITEIVDLLLAGLNKRLEDRKVSVVFTSAAKKWIGEKGYDPTYGARPLKGFYKSRSRLNSPGHWLLEKWKREAKLLFPSRMMN
jgi:ATP-dependent Clp protease ATP-binding subunit ClpB